MIYSILMNAALLSLGGLGVYSVFSNASERGVTVGQQLLLGFVLGAVVLLVSANAVILGAGQVPVDAKAGPLMIAGYLGGPIAALVAAGIGGLYRLSMGGADASLAILIYFAMAFGGVGIARFLPSNNWPRIPNFAVLAMVLLCPVLQILPAPLLSWQHSDAIVQDKAMVALTLAAANTLSILVTALLMRFSYRFAADSARVAELGRRIRSIAEVGRIGSFDHPVDSRLVSVDAGFIALYGLKRTEGWIEASEWFDRVHPDDRPVLRDESRRAMSDEKNHGWVEFRALNQDDDYGYIRAYWREYTDGNGKKLGYSGFHEDITELRLAELAREASANRMRQIIANLPGALISLDLSNFHKATDAFSVLYASPQCEEIWGYSAGEIEDSPRIILSAINSEDTIKILRAMVSSARTFEPFSARFRMTARDGQAKHLEIYTRVSRHADGRIVADGFIVDVTTEIHAQQQLEFQTEVAQQAQKHESLGQLTGGVAHDFNNILAVIMGNLELLNDEVRNDPAQQCLIDASLAATHRGADLTRNMLAFARKAPLAPRAIDLNKLVQESQSWIGRTLPSTIHVETLQQPGLWLVEADLASTQSAVLNLILNARDAMPEGGHLTIKTSNLVVDQGHRGCCNDMLGPGQYVVLSIMDDGQGIPEAIHEKIFEPFYSTKKPGAGSGLGLSMVMGFMRQSGGSVCVTSKPGEGATFMLMFPASGALAEDLDVAASHQTDAGPDKGSRILVAEDQPEVLAMLITMLEKAGYDVTAASSGDEAHRIYEDDPTFDLLLTDIVMPGQFLGTDLARVLRDKRPDLPVVFMSGYAADSAVGNGDLRADDTRLMKPVKRNVLLQVLSQKLHGTPPANEL